MLIDGTGADAWPHQLVIIKDGKISWVGDNTKVIKPKGAKTINLNGKAINPTPKQLVDVTSYPLITKSLVDKGYSEKDIDKI